MSPFAFVGPIASARRQQQQNSLASRPILNSTMNGLDIIRSFNIQSNGRLVWQARDLRF